MGVCWHHPNEEERHQLTSRSPVAVLCCHSNSDIWCFPLTQHIDFPQNTSPHFYSWSTLAPPLLAAAGLSRGMYEHAADHYWIFIDIYTRPPTTHPACSLVTPSSRYLDSPGSAGQGSVFYSIVCSSLPPAGSVHSDYTSAPIFIYWVSHY